MSSDDNLWRKFERIVKPWMIVLLFVIILLFGFHKEGKADEVVSAEIGPTLLSGQFSEGAMLLVNYTWDDRWRIGMGVSSEQKVTPRNSPETNVRQNLYVHGQRLVHITSKLDFGLGVGYFNATTRWNGTNFVASMSVEYNFTDKWKLSFRHFSNAGSGSPNMGQDVLLIGYSF